MTATALFRPATHRRTPSVTVFDNRGLPVRQIQYHRHPDTPDLTDECITCHRYNARGHLTQSADPRLHGTGRANFSYLSGLTGSALRTVSADAGVTVVLNDAAGRLFIALSNIRTADDGTEDRSQSVTRTWQYEGADLPGRPLGVTEQVTGEIARMTERFVYAGSSDAERARNLAGQCVSHYDTAGRVQTNSISLTGVPLSVTRRLLRDADNPAAVADWQGADASAWNDLLTGESEGYTTLTTADATGAVLTTTDAKGNRQRSEYDVAGQLSGSWLTLKGGTEQAIVTSLAYSAAGQKLREEHGNGVMTTYTYEAETQRLTGIKTERPAGHSSGAKVLQDLRYEYDPVGNVLKVGNDAEETRFWRNQKVVPENTCAYDSLYQLVTATGREMANAGQQGSGLPAAAVPLPTDSSAYTNYTRIYRYDSAGNLTQIRHSAPATGNSYTTDITVSDRSNRGVLSTLTEKPSEVDALFTAGGQQLQLLPGQSLIWTPRNELLKVTPVVRDGGADDSESYRYDAGSQRILKVSVQKTGNSVQTQRVLYLPGLELRSTKAGSTETESLQVITVGEAGRAQVRVLHWESGKLEDISNNQVRYSYDNLTGSSGLELDGDGNVISMEEYYPYGGTAVWTARSQTEADYKTIHYSGKERDATGLYCYGYRYYQPWAGRWLSADPAGTVDGLNLFRMVRNNPVGFWDVTGLAPLQSNTGNSGGVKGYMGISKCDAHFSNVNETQFWNRVISFNNFSPDSVDNQLINRLGKIRNVVHAVNFEGVPEEDVGMLLTEHGQLTEHLIKQKKLTPELEHEMNKINRLMEVLPGTDGTALYRGVRNSVDKRFPAMLADGFHKNNDVYFKTTSYLSFSESPFIVKNYITDAVGNTAQDGLLFVNEKSTGAARAISFYSPTPGEAEVLYPLDKYFKLKHATQLHLEKGPIWRIKISEVQGINQHDNAKVFDFWGEPIRLTGGL